MGFIQIKLPEIKPGLIYKALCTSYKGWDEFSKWEVEWQQFDKDIHDIVSRKMNVIQKYKEFDVYFKNADYVDVKTIEGDTDLRSFISGMLSYYPWWLVSLYKIREIIVSILGLVHREKPDTLPSIKPEDLSFKPGANASFFIVRDAKEDVYWVSESPKDKHLAAFFGVVAEKLSQNFTRYHVFTCVKYLHWTGPVYFNLIRPFHHIVVRCMMKAGIKKRRIA